MFPSARAWAVDGRCSDHLPLFLQLHSLGRKSFVRGLRYENSWGKLDECKGIVEGFWSRTSSVPIGTQLGQCGRAVWSWGRGRRKNESESLQYCQRHLTTLRNLSDEESVREFGDAQRQYMTLVQNQSDRYRQRAKEMWYVGGDSNTRFFHNSVNCRRKKNHIHSLRNSRGDVVTDESAKGEIMVDYILRSLQTDITSVEVRAALYAMHPNKSSGPDGLSPAFFQTHWDVVGDEGNGRRTGHPLNCGLWSPPPVGYLRVNIDDALDFAHRRTSLGWVMRTAEGVVIGVVMKRIEGLLAVREAEAMGAREALSWLKGKGWNQVIIESDAQVVTDGVSRGGNGSPYGAVLQEIRVLMDQFESASLWFVRRELNMPAHVVAKKSLYNSSDVLAEYCDFIPH
ncbi:uncharacterized protein LOC116003486 isoform X2 [Ipomoea triloba]|uniref:uncharacterized protein LOC116003486 isoform X2 n=1 Tax=Ipomoea triloba TaxID=35885 RepID=UPI00125D469B|nr:uncharacterized protein LOC116003486 isoform X2 [Ipomoea triloba]